MTEAPPLGEELTDFIPRYSKEFLKEWPRTVSDKLNRTLCNLARKSRVGGTPYKIMMQGAEAQYSIAFADTEQEARFYIDCLRKQGLLDDIAGVRGWVSAVVTAEGWKRFEELTRTHNSRENPAFVAMWFGSDDAPRQDMDRLFREGIEPAIEEAGYCATRVDLVPHDEFIMNKVLGDIRIAPFVVADFTGQRNGVYFEAGFARGMNIPVIHTCRESDFNNAHFDTGQLPHLLWNTPDDLKDKLREWIRGWLGPGPHPS